MSLEYDIYHTYMDDIDHAGQVGIISMYNTVYYYCHVTLPGNQEAEEPQKPIVYSKAGILLTHSNCLPVKARKSKKECRTKPRRLLTFRMMSNHQMMLNVNLSQACLQLPIDEYSKPFLTITHTRVYKTMYMSGYNHLSISVVKALPCVSEANGAVLQGIPVH